MLSSCLWMQEACLQPWQFAGTLHDAHTQWAATAGRTKLGVAQDSRRGLSWPLHAMCCSLSFASSFRQHIHSQASLFARPNLPWVGRRVSWWVGKYSTESFSATVPRRVVAAPGLPWIPPSLLCIAWLHRPWGTNAQAHLLMMSLIIIRYRISVLFMTATELVIS